MTTPAPTFPFGSPVQRCRPVADGPRSTFVLGAYPSALHIQWRPPSPHRLVKALAVDNEPEPFWSGADQAARVSAWLRAVSWRTEWGEAREVGRLNGSSGAWLEKEILAPLKLSASSAWITDCLDTYYLSKEAEKRLRDTYDALAAQRELGFPAWSLPPHPSEKGIFDLALQGHLDRLGRELSTARPARLITLGNAALRVLRHLAKVPPAVGPSRLAPGDGYGAPVRITLADLGDLEWLPLAHPGAPAIYQQAHATWRDRQ